MVDIRPVEKPGNASPLWVTNHQKTRQLLAFGLLDYDTIQCDSYAVATVQIHIVVYRIGHSNFSILAHKSFVNTLPIATSGRVGKIVESFIEYICNNR